MEFMEIIRLLIPVATFAMGYFLTNIGYKRDRKLAVVRERFEKLYHPFYMMINQLGTGVEEGFELDTDTIKPFIDHLVANSYLASSEGQRLIWGTREIFMSCCTADGVIDKEKEPVLHQPLAALFSYLMKEYLKTAHALGYDMGADVPEDESEYAKVKQTEPNATKD